MTLTDAFIQSNTEIRKGFLDAGWTDGDKVDNYTKSKTYFFNYIIMKDKLVNDQSPIRNLFAVWGVQSIIPAQFADDEYGFFDSTVYVTFNLTDPLTDEKISLSLGKVEKELIKSGWKMSLLNADNYDDSNKIRNLQVSFTKKIVSNDD
jgi:hypothetical protein